MGETCPNCGQPSRPGARFCTSCGFRLPERQVDSEGNTLSRSPFATTSTVAASMWPSSTQKDGESKSPSTQEASDSESMVSGAEDQPDEGALPGSGNADSAGESGEASSEPEPSADAEAAAPSGEQTDTQTQSDSYPVWPSFPSYGATDNAAAPSWNAENASSEPDDSVWAELAELNRRPGAEPVEPSEPAEPAESAESAPHVEAPPEPDHDLRLDHVYALRHDAEPVAASQPDEGEESGAAPSNEAFARARSLLDELSALLPTLAGATAGTQSDASQVKRILSDARNGAEGEDSRDADEASFAVLMEVVESVRARPRDIDGVLDLSRHVDSIVRMKEQYDRMQRAIDEALGHLD